jgi:uncharacterized membrane protein
MFNYGLFLISIFFAGAPGLIAAAIAYSQKTRVAPLLRSHYRFQIVLFWSAFLLGAVAAGLFVIGLTTAIFDFLAVSGGDWTDNVPMLRDLGAHGPALFMILLGVLIAAIDGAWLLAASTFGLIRLASHRGLGKSAA